MSFLANSRKLRSLSEGKIAFWCLGCDMPHPIQVRPAINPSRPSWEWNGESDTPVLSPSVLVRYDTLSEGQRHRAAEFYKKHGRHPSRAEVPSDVFNICHSFVGCNGARPGEIIYLSDTTHEYSGRVIPLPDFPEAWT